MNYLDDIIAHAGVGLHKELFAARDAEGNPLTILCYEPGQVEPLRLEGVGFGRFRISDEIEDIHGTHVRDEVEDVVEAQVPLSQAFGLYEPKTESKFEIPSHPGEKFSLLEVLDLSATWAHLRLNRVHVSRIRRNRSERS